MVHVSATDTMPDLSGRTIDHGRLRLLESLGSGAYGKVYRAVDTTSPTHRKVYYAVKCLFKPAPGSHQEKFQTREFEIHKLVSDHPNIVTFHRVVVDDSFVYVVLDLCSGGDLFSAITERQIFHEDGQLVKTAFVQLIDAVHYCHEQGVFHRDIKPENVLCSLDGTNILLADFGLSTRNHVCKDFGCGSSYYMSPECIGQELSIGRYSSRHSDIWSLGVILTNMISGRNPWRFATAKDDCFGAYIQDRNFLRQVLPISRGANAILKQIFNLNPLKRIPLPDLRHEILKLDTFFMGPEELALASAPIRAAAAAVRPKDKQAKDHHHREYKQELPGRTLIDPQPQPQTDGGESPLSVDSDERYAFASPTDEQPPVVVVEHHHNGRTDETALAVRGESPPAPAPALAFGSSSGREDDRSEAITPATFAVDPAVEVPDLPTNQGIGESAFVKPVVIHHMGGEDRKERPSMRASNFIRMAMRGFRALSLGSR